MNPNIRTPKSVYVTLASGFVLGAVSMAGIFSGQAVGQAPVHAPTFQPRLMANETTESMNELRRTDQSYRALAKFVGPAVVDIRAQQPRAATETGVRMPLTGGEGSGFIFRPDGYIITNEHVVGNAETVKVTLKDGREFDGKVTKANDPNSDIALVKIDAKDLPTLAFADSATVEPGEIVMAVGAPFGLENSVTAGHVSAIGRSNVIANRGYSDLIQTDAAINMGNSGGPLVNIDGQVIGINTAIYSPTGGSNGIGFAIPSNQAKLIADLLISKGKITRSMLGIVPEDIKEYQRKDMNLPDGAAIAVDVVGEPAVSAGFQKDDIIVRIGSVPVHGQMDLRNAMLRYAPGTEVEIEFLRDGNKQTKKVKLLPYKVPRELAQMTPNTTIPKFFDMDPDKMPDLKDFHEFKGMPKFPNLKDDSTKDVPRIREGKAQLGVSVIDASDSIRKQFHIPSNLTGAVVANVADNSVADRLGMQEGDIVLMVGDKKIGSAKDLVNALKDLKWGDQRRIKYQRFGEGNAVMSIDSTVTFK